MLLIDLYDDSRKLEITIVTRRDNPMLCVMEVQPTLIEEIWTSHGTNLKLERIMEEVLTRKAPWFIIEDGTLRFNNKVCALTIGQFKKKILDEGHNTLHSVHPGGNQLYYDLKQIFWWSNIKQEVANYVASV